MGKLNQVIAIEKGVKSRTANMVNQYYHGIQKPDLFNGLTKTYEPLDEAGERFPAEASKIQLAYQDVLAGVAKAWGDLYQVTARKDYTNCVARANVSVDNEVIIADAPVSFLLFMEKELVNVRTLVEKLPVLDNALDWVKDENTGLYKTAIVQTHRTKKVEKVIVKYQATKEHPAQTEIRAEDVLVGYWNTIKHSGAIPLKIKLDMLERLDKLAKAVKIAREEANMIEEVKLSNIGEAVFSYVFGS